MNKIFPKKQHTNQQNHTKQPKTNLNTKHNKQNPQQT